MMGGMHGGVHGRGVCGGGHVGEGGCLELGHVWHTCPPADTTRYGQ